MNDRFFRSDFTAAIAFFSMVMTLGVATPPTQAQDDWLGAVQGGYVLLADGDVRGARQTFEAILNTVDYGPAYGGLAACAAAEGDWTTAVAQAREAVQRDPTIPIAQTLLCRGLVVDRSFAEAVPFCVRAIELDPNDPVAYVSLCTASVARYRWTEAVTYCGAGAEIAPDDDDLNWRLGVALTHVGQHGTAETHCRAAMESAPENPMGYYCLGALMLEAGRASNAFSACDFAIDAGPSNALGHYCRGMSNLALGNIPEAVTDCENAVQLAPREALGHYCLGRIQREGGRVDEAVTHLMQAIELNGRLIEARGSLGDVLTQAGRLEEGERWLREALERDERADRYGQLGVNLMAQRRFLDALAAFEAADERRPNDARTLSNMAAVYRQMGDHASMYTSMQAAVDADPTNARWVSVQLDTALALQHYERAVVVARAGVQQHPNHPGLAQGLCAALVRDGQYQAAESECVRSRALSPGASESLMMLSVIYINTDRAVEAEEALRGAIDAGVDDAYVWFNLGSALAGQQRIDEAADAFRTAIARDRTLAVAHFMLGNALQASGNVDAARAAWCEAAAQAPERARFTEACDQ